MAFDHSCHCKESLTLTGTRYGDRYRVKFWRLKKSNYDSDYRHSYINGSLEHPFALLEDTSTEPRYSEIVILNESGFPPGGTPLSVCSGCRRREIGKSRQIKMTHEIWKGNSIFFLSITLHIVVTDKLRAMIEQLRPTNIEFIPI